MIVILVQVSMHGILVMFIESTFTTCLAKYLNSTFSIQCPTPKNIGFMRLAHVFEHMILLELVFLFPKGTLCFSRRTRVTYCISLCFWFYREAGLTLSLAELECKRIFCCICELLTIIALNTYIFL